MKTQIPTWIIVVVGVLFIAAAIWVFSELYKHKKFNDSMMQNTNINRDKAPITTSCPKGYTLNKGHCVCTNPPCGLLPPDIS